MLFEMVCVAQVHGCEKTMQPCPLPEGLHIMIDYVAFRLVGDFGAEELTVETCDVAQLDVLGALGSAGTGVGAVAESEFVHLGHHGLGAAFSLDASLRKECELANLG